MISYGILGCGMMGREHIQNIRLLKDTRVSHIYEPNAEMRQQAAQLAPEAVFVETVSDILNAKGLDAVVIASPNFRHAEQLKQVALQPNLAVLVEKPLITDPKDEAFIKELEANHKAPIWVAMEYRYMPAVTKLIEQAKTATGGIDMLSIQEHRFPFLEKVDDWNRFNAYSGGTFVEKCCHFFDLMRHILGSDPVRVYASAGQAHNHVTERYEGKQPDIWDHGYALVDFESGARAKLELCMFAEGSTFQETISAVGQAGKIECMVPGPKRFWPTGLGDQPQSRLVTSPRRDETTKEPPRLEEIGVPEAIMAAGDHHGSTFYQHQKFQAAIKGQGPVEVSLHDGLWAVKMGMAVQDSARLHEVVTF